MYEVLNDNTGLKNISSHICYLSWDVVSSTMRIERLEGSQLWVWAENYRTDEGLVQNVSKREQKGLHPFAGFLSTVIAYILVEKLCHFDEEKKNVQRLKKSTPSLLEAHASQMLKLGAFWLLIKVWCRQSVCILEKVTVKTLKSALHSLGPHQYSSSPDSLRTCNVPILRPKPRFLPVYHGSTYVIQDVACSVENESWEDGDKWNRDPFTCRKGIASDKVHNHAFMETCGLFGQNEAW